MKHTWTLPTPAENGKTISGESGFHFTLGFKPCPHISTDFFFQNGSHPATLTPVISLQLHLDSTKTHTISDIPCQSHPCQHSLFKFTQCNSNASIFKQIQRDFLRLTNSPHTVPCNPTQFHPDSFVLLRLMCGTTPFHSLSL